jgi:hypothetical protein
MTDKLKSLRESARVSQLALSRLTQVSRFRLNLAERGLCVLSPEEISKIE